MHRDRRQTSRGRPHAPARRRGAHEPSSRAVRSTLSSWPSPTCKGRLQGKRFAARFFLDEVLEHGTEGCNYLLAVDTDMNTVDGYAMSSWERGYGDFAMHPDLGTLRRIPWNAGTALLIADLAWNDGSPGRRRAPADPAPPAGPARRARLHRPRRHRAGVHRLQGHLRAGLGRATTASCTPANQYNIDYSVLGTGRIEPLLRRIRNEMAAAGLTVESAKGECNPGQHEIVFRYDEALVTCDQHAIYKTGAKEIAAQEGVSLTFMAKYNEREGNSCHIHLSLQRRGRRQRHGRRRRPGGMSRSCGTSWPASSPRCVTSRSSTRPTSTPTSASSPAPSRPPPSPGATTTAPAPCGSSATAARMRFENRLPGGDVNPYLAVAGTGRGRACTASSSELELPEACTGNAYTADVRARPHHPARGRRALGEQPDRPGRLRRRGRRPLPQHGPRRAGRLRRRGHRLGAAPLLRTPVKEPPSSHRVSARADHDPQPGHRGGRRHRPGRHRRRGRRRRRAGRRRPARLGGRSPPPTGPGCCAASPPSSTSTSRNWPRWRSARPATPSATPAGRRATSAICSTTRPGEWSG